MKITWLVEKFLFDEYEKRLCQTIKDSGSECIVIDDTDINFDFDKKIKNRFTDKDCVIFYGSLQLGRKIHSRTNFIPGIFLTIENYECYKYYGFYGNKLLNSDYLMMGLNDVKRNKEKIFNYFSIDSIFIRPSNGYKTFTGQCLNKEKFEYELDVLCKSYDGVDMDQLVVIAKKQDVHQESRFIIIDSKLIDGSIYMIDGVLNKEKMIDLKAMELAQSVIGCYEPDRAFTIDIAKLKDGNYKILEIGSFCCASLYNADFEKVINAMNSLMIKEYNDYWNLLDE
jgi:hypothetical protein